MRISADLLEQKFKLDAHAARDACIDRSAKIDAGSQNTDATLDEVRSLFLLSAAFQYLANCVPSYRARDPAFAIQHDEHVDVCDFADYVFTGRNEQLRDQVRISLHEMLAQFCHRRIGIGSESPLVASVAEVLAANRQFNSREMSDETSREIHNAVSRYPHASSVDLCICQATLNTDAVLTEVKIILEQILDNPSVCAFVGPEGGQDHSEAA